MSDLAELYPDFAAHWIDAPAGRIFARAKGDGPAVLLLHGFGETNVVWARVAPQLAKRFFVVAMDLRGCGWSAAPESEKGEAYSKRAMAEDVVAVMEALGHAQFAAIGHDRGALVGARLALDHPGRLSRLALIDALPFDDSGADLQRVGRARFLSFEAPRPENLLALDPNGFLDDAIKNATKDKSLHAIDARALAHYQASFSDPTRQHAACEDYRAGATIDRDLLQADLAAGRRIAVPTLALWGEAAFPADSETPLDAWRPFVSDLRGEALDCGARAPEEAPEAVLQALEAFL
jgi:haloacetate dehalogenase